MEDTSYGTAKFVSKWTIANGYMLREIQWINGYKLRNRSLGDIFEIYSIYNGKYQKPLYISCDVYYYISILV